MSAAGAAGTSSPARDHIGGHTSATAGTSPAVSHQPAQPAASHRPPQAHRPAVSHRPAQPAATHRPPQAHRPAVSHQPPPQATRGVTSATAGTSAAEEHQPPQALSRRDNGVGGDASAMVASPLRGRDIARQSEDQHPDSRGEEHRQREAERAATAPGGRIEAMRKARKRRRATVSMPGAVAGATTAATPSMVGASAAETVVRAGARSSAATQASERPE